MSPTFTMAGFAPLAVDNCCWEISDMVAMIEEWEAATDAHGIKDAA